MSLSSCIIDGMGHDGTAAMQNTLIRLKEVERRTGLSKSAIYRRAGAGTFPRPVPLGHSMSAWVESEVDAWVDACITLRDQSSALPADVRAAA